MAIKRKTKKRRGLGGSDSPQSARNAHDADRLARDAAVRADAGDCAGAYETILRAEFALGKASAQTIAEGRVLSLMTHEVDNVIHAGRHIAGKCVIRRRKK